MLSVVSVDTDVGGSSSSGIWLSAGAGVEEGAPSLEFLASSSRPCCRENGERMIGAYGAVSGGGELFFSCWTGASELELRRDRYRSKIFVSFDGPQL